MAQQEIELSIPTSYADITLRKWLALQKELENYKGNEEAESALMLYHLCGLGPEYLKGISVIDYAEIKAELTRFISNTEFQLQRFIWIDGIEYGFEPNLSQMAYGAFADITKHNVIGIDDNWAKMMAILYRPILKKVGDTYTIQTYAGDGQAKRFLDLGMDIHFGALFFFVNLSTDLLNSILKSTMVQLEHHPHIKLILARSGELIQQSSNWQKTIFSK